MRSPGVTPVLFGACLASAGVRECSCFTASLRVSTGRPAAAAAPASLWRSNKINSTKNSSGRPARFSAARTATARGRPSSAASSPTAAAAALGDCSGDVSSSSSSSQGKPSSFKGNESTTRRRRSRRQRRPTLLAGGRGSPTTAEQQQPQPPQVDAEGSMTTSQQLSAEVSARRSRSRAWGLVGFPPGGYYDGDSEGLTSSSSYPLIGEDSAAGAAVADATDSALRGRYREEHRDWQEKLERLVDMSEPPPELLAAAQTRSIGDMMPPPPATKSLEEEGQQQPPQQKQQGGGAEDGLWTSRAMLAGAAMLYGTNFGCVKLLEESVPMSLAAALRFSVALVPFVPFLKKVNPGVFRAGAEVGLLNAIGYWAQSESLMTTTASKSAFICSLAVVFVPLLDALLGGDKKDSPKAAQEKAAAGGGGGGVFAAMNGPWFPALLAAAGVACLELIGVEGGPNSGDVWALVQPLCFGLGFWLTERCSRKYPEEIFGLVAAQLLTVAVLAVGWCAQAGDLPLSLASLRETVLPSSGNLAVPISLMWTGLVTTSLTVFGETVAMKKVSAAESTIILSTEPIWGTAFAAVLLGESIGWNTGLGAVLIVSACTWTSVGPALQSKMLSLAAAVAGAGTVVEGGDDLAETVGTVIKEIVKDP
ncbi:conserved unknown protein [Ectocarpus siliculosus]|uniref:EamA domain-containing protein n=1 Tax=Ectocarpus siliculosus TaxID=2880 RepID=D7FVY2_ECTSI|nr:conserved unknown protein [Ectocarpus siliculosus]|eukprot:CBJ25502.1 conserved unknown protein [Ectocarpus siliculosus]